MFNITVTRKLVGLICGVVLVLTAISILAVYSKITEELDKTAQKTLTDDSLIVDFRFKDIQNNYLSLAKSQAIRPNVIKGISENDVALLQKLGRDLIASKSAEFVVFTDLKGNVIARGHTDKQGDNIANQYALQQALLDKPAVGVENGAVVKLSLRASAPVKQDGKIIGVVILGMNIFEGNSFVDGIKEMTGSECTIFENDVRVSTTIKNNGSRAIGTKMDNPKVLQTVLREGKTFNSRNIILGGEFLTSYWPLKDIQGNVVGMFFLGRSTNDIQQAQHVIILGILYWMLGAGVLLGLLGVWVGRIFIKPLILSTRFAVDVSQGNLDSVLVVNQTDEMGVLARALNQMLITLKQKIQEADQQSKQAQEQTEIAQQAMLDAQQALEQASLAKREGELAAASKLEGIVSRVNSSSTQLTHQVDEINEGMGIQTQRIAETATAIEQMNATVMEVAKNASHAASNAQMAKEKAESGSQIVRDSVEAITTVSQVASLAKQNMEVLGKQVSDIGSIISVINDIADQTNLLALNAAIEAARAGDAGRGFAVVADEVRKLAEKTQNATKEVASSISSIQQSAKLNIEQMEKAASAIDNAIKLAQVSGESLTEIVMFADQNSGQAQSIAAASEEQSAASEQISRSIDEINRIAADTATSMHQSSAAISELAKLAGELTSLIEELKK